MLRRSYERCVEQIRSWTPSERGQAVLMIVIVIGALAHHLPLFTWYIEDAAISFAYSKHLAMGEGLVPFIGGERVEGYSNPAWVFFLAPFSWFFDLHAFVKYLQVVMVVPTVLFTWFAARELMGRQNAMSLLAPAALAASAQFAIWSGAGLEMGLMNLLMAAAIWRSMVELRSPQWPWSALLWLGVTLCRPEAILYAAVGGFCSMVFTLHAGRGVLPTAKWLVTFFLPFGLYHAWRYNYFAWEFPNTYYAKLERRDDVPILDWSSKSWRYTRDFLTKLGWGFFLPVWVLGAIGHRGWRLPVAASVSLLVAVTASLAGEQRHLLAIIVVFMLYAFWEGLARIDDGPPPRTLAATGLAVSVGLIATAEALRFAFGMEPQPLPVPDWLDDAPAYVILASSVLLGVLGYGSRNWQGRLLTWLLCCAALTFAIVAQWDWMKGYRWYAPAVVPGAILFALGAASLGHVVQRFLQFRPEHDDRLTPLGVATAFSLIAVALVPNITHTVWVATHQDTEPEDVRVRVHFVNRVRERLQVDEQWVDLDVDQGAHLYWSDFEMMDIAGLIEVPLGHHKFQRPFLKEYVFEERRPHFVHIHAGWASSSRIPTYREFKQQYVQIPGYVANAKQFHIGNYIRRDLVLPEAWPHAEHKVSFGDGKVLFHGLHVPSEPAVGGKVHVRVGLSAPALRKKQGEDDVRALLFVSDGEKPLHTWDIAPGYDWIFPSEWNGDEVFVGRFDLKLPASIEPGRYDLGLVLLDGDGTVLAPARPDLIPEAVALGGTDARPALVAQGEIVLEGLLEVLPVQARNEASEADHATALTAASDTRCADAEHAWLLARKHRPGDVRWIRGYTEEMRRALANCWARHADGLSDRQEQVASLVKARTIDHWAPDYRERALPLAQELYGEGLAARAAEDWESAYRRFSDAVDLDRSLAWARRYAEEARGFRLGIDDATLAEKAREKEEARERARQAREDAKRKRQAQLEKKAQEDAEQEDE